jgi:hypothetical protein
MKEKFYKEESRKNWYVNTSEALTREQLQLGAILRIADACEAMAKNHERLLSDLAYYEKRTKELLDRNSHLYRSNCALRGVIKKRKQEQK